VEPVTSSRDDEASAPGRRPGGTVLCLLNRLHRWLTYRPERRYMRGR
jgi:hypothetical protein